MDNSRDHYSPLVLLCRLQDLLWLVELAGQGMTEVEQERAARTAKEMRDIYGERRYIPNQPTGDT